MWEFYHVDNFRVVSPEERFIPSKAVKTLFGLLELLALVCTIFTVTGMY